MNIENESLKTQDDKDLQVRLACYKLGDSQKGLLETQEKWVRALKEVLSECDCEIPY